jgi:hypothetical protein
MEGRDGMERRGGNMIGLVLTKGEADGGMAIKPILASANAFQEIFSLFPSTKAIKVER